MAGVSAGRKGENHIKIAIGEAVACYVLGLLLLTILPRIPALRGRLTLRA